MAFTHGKRGRLWVDGIELTAFFNDFQMMAKAGVAETTVYGLGAKTFIGGLKEGQISAKGYFGASALDPEDPTLSRALGRQQNMSILFTPDGTTAVGDRVIVAYAAETDLEIMTPVTGVVATSMTAQADSGLSTGVWLYDPEASPIAGDSPVVSSGQVVNTFPEYSETLAVVFDSQNVTTWAGSSSFSATGSPMGWPTSGTLTLANINASSVASITYTNYTVSGSTVTFTGCTFTSDGGSGPFTLTSGNLETVYTANAPFHTTGAVAVLELTNFTDASNTATAYISLSGSIDGYTYIYLAIWSPWEGQTLVYPSPGYSGDPSFLALPSPGLATGSTFVISSGFPIPQFLQVVSEVTVGMSTAYSLTFGAAISLQ
jgi:hypothetical protein